MTPFKTKRLPSPLQCVLRRQAESVNKHDVIMALQQPTNQQLRFKLAFSGTEHSLFLSPFLPFLSLPSHLSFIFFPLLNFFLAFLFSFYERFFNLPFIPHSFVFLFFVCLFFFFCIRSEEVGVLYELIY